MTAGPVLLTGGSGVLGSELRALMPDLHAPPRAALDVLDADSVVRALRELRPGVVVHAAAYTDVAGAERDRALCWRANVGGTREVVAAARQVGARLVHISTDYVFYGSGPLGSRADEDGLQGDVRDGQEPEGQGTRERAGYREDDPPGPVRNYYALSKLAAEEVARTLPGTLVIRTSFRPRVWPYPVAFTDVFTSQDYVDVIAPDIALAVRNLDRIPFDTLHIATERKSVYQLAKRRRPDVKAGTRASAGVDLPEDITLDVSRWRALKATFPG